MWRTGSLSLIMERKGPMIWIQRPDGTLNRRLGKPGRYTSMGTSQRPGEGSGPAWEREWKSQSDSSESRRSVDLPPGEPGEKKSYLSTGNNGPGPARAVSNHDQYKTWRSVVDSSQSLSRATETRAGFPTGLPAASRDVSWYHVCQEDLKTGRRPWKKVAGQWAYMSHSQALVIVGRFEIAMALRSIVNALYWILNTSQRSPGKPLGITP